MAKDLPYFKFFCSEWTDGDITLESYDIQGLFINVCSYYWSNECYLHIDKLKKRFKHNVKDIEYLFEINVIHNENGFLSIHFLDEQQEDRKQTSKQNSKAGKASAEARRLKKEREANEKLTGVKKALNVNPTIKRREEKKREEEKENILFNEFWDLYDKKVGDKTKVKKKYLKLSEEAKQLIKVHVPKYKKAQPNKKYRKDPATYLNNSSWLDEIIEDSSETINYNNPTLANPYKRLDK